MIRIGNASSPRWYDLSPIRLEEYIDRLAGWGASTTELVLHHGEYDDRTARVHVLEEDWLHVFERYHAHGFLCNAHAPLHPRFKFDRFISDPAGIQAEFLPVIHAVSDFSERQGASCTLVVHGASGGPSDPREATAGFLVWVAEELRRAGSGRIALELRPPGNAMRHGFDRSRTALTEFVEWIGNDRIGICWDIAHDWESSLVDSQWDEVPDARFLRLVSHVHLHDAGTADALVHHPLKSGRVPWRSMLRSLLDAGYDGAVILEIRYRLATALGEPWHVLGESYAMLASIIGGSTALDSEQIRSIDNLSTVHAVETE